MLTVAEWNQRALWRTALILVMATGAAWGTVACKNEKPPEAPKRGASDGQGTRTDTNTNTGTNTGLQQGQIPATGVLTITPEVPGPYRFPAGQPVRLAFRLGNDTGRQLQAAMAEGPVGTLAQLETGKVTMVWNQPMTGSHTIRILVRDMGQCATAETDQTLCQINPSQLATMVAKPYDVMTDRIMVEIQAGGLGTGTGGNQGLINQINGLTGGGGNQGLLQGLTGGQLQSLLGMLQNGGGGGLDLATLVQLVSSLSLTGDAPGTLSESGADGTGIDPSVSTDP